MLHQKWRPLNRLVTESIPPHLLSWLGERHSLTRRLRQCCSCGIEVRVRSQAWCRPTYDEASHLGVEPTTIALIREVHLLCAGTPWVYARSIIPLATLDGPLRRLKFLGSRPLGDLLFADPGILRREIEITAVTRDSPQYSIASEGGQEGLDVIWGRRSVFNLRRKPLLVSEYFLPALCQTTSKTITL